GVGGFGWLLLSFPEQFLDYLHVPAYGLLAWLGITGLSRRGWSLFSALTAASLSTLVFGLWTETLQVSVPGRGLELQDVILDGIGIVAADIVAFRRSARLRLARGRYSRSITTLEDPA
ncbi:MAG TPA: VanZ family protein, partial [Nitrospiraceae bacterium]|nr:VanZ family protein [Nitrospiraceae bacterium]